MRTKPQQGRKRSWVSLLWVGFLLQSLTYCSGSTTTRGGSSAAGDAGLGAAGQTADCISSCHLGCPCAGGTSAGGSSTGSSGIGGTSAGGSSTGSSGIGGTIAGSMMGFAGHTSDCLTNCHGGCGFCGGGPNGGTPAGGTNGLGGALDGLGGAAEGGQTLGGAPDGGAPAAKRISAAQEQEQRACYALSGYEADPCLPADDSLLAWLSTPNMGCPLTVVSGPSLMSGPIGRACCYSVSCAQPRE